MLTAEDDKIRRLDVPERLQVASAGLPDFAFDDEANLVPLIPETEVPTAARWMAERLGRDISESYLLQDAATGELPQLHAQFILAVENVVRFLNVDLLEPPHIWHHRADYLFHAPSGSTPHALLHEDHLWRLSALSIKYRAFLARRAELAALVDKLGCAHDAHVAELVEQAQGVEDVMDAMAWVALMFGEGTAAGLAKRAKKEEQDDEERARKALEDGGEAGGESAEARAQRERDKDEAAAKRQKRAARESEYELAKKSVVKRLAEVRRPLSSLIVIVVAARAPRS